MTRRSKQITYSERPTRASRRAHARGEQMFRTYDTSSIRPRRSKAPIVVAVVLVVVVIAVIAFLLSTCSSSKADLLPSDQTAVVVVESGEGAMAIGQSLADEKLVESADAFAKRVVALGAESSLLPGAYEFRGGTSLDEIISALRQGPSSTGIALTIPEGLTREATAQVIDNATDGRISAEDFLAVTANASDWVNQYSFLQSAGTHSLEGFLFPKTYTVTAVDDARSVTAMMLDQFQTEIANLSFAYPQSQGLDLYQTVILASIVEKECADEHRTTVASVFYNRLASDRPYLESDATTAYEVGHDPTGEEVHSDTPYSTYTNAGLPPTPICSPSLECLEAVCNPDSTDYLFFYFRPNDSGGLDYFFSRTYEEHQQAIAS